MTKDFLEGAEELEKRFLQRVRSMTYEQVEDDGGLLCLLHRECVKMLDEWTDSLESEWHKSTQSL